MELEVVVEDRLILSTIELKKLNSLAFKTVKQIFTYDNPKYLENEKWGRQNFDTPQFLKSYEIYDSKMFISRGGKAKLETQLFKFKIEVVYIDRTLVCKSVDFNQSNVALRDDQEAALKIMRRFEDGCMVAYTSFGKTIFLMELARIIAQPTLVIVHTTFLQEQWIKEATDKKKFNLSKDQIGGVGGVFSGKKRKFGDLNVCLYQSLENEEHVDFFKERVGCVMFDEGQKSPIEGVQKVTNKFRGRYRFTASANLERADGKQFLTYDTYGPVRHVVEEVESASKILAKVIVVKSDYEDTDYDYDNQYSTMLTRMGINKNRNILICKRAITKVRQGKLVMILVERKAQALILKKYLSKFRVEMLLGPTNWRDFDKQSVIDASLAPTAKLLRVLKKSLEAEGIPYTDDEIDNGDYAFIKGVINNYELEFDSEENGDGIDLNARGMVKRLKEIPKATIEMLDTMTPTMIRYAREYDDKGAYKKINALAEKKDLDIIIGTQKAEVGLNIRTLDHGIVTTPAFGNTERGGQIKGRFERTYSEEQELFFGHKKPTPTLDLIYDTALRPSRNAISQARADYAGSIFNLRKNKKR
jgi:superfamily II DNA or RNA helicase